MTEKPANDWQSKACASADGCECVPEVMEANTYKSRVTLDRAPWPFKIGTGLIAHTALDQKACARGDAANLRDIDDHGDRRGIQRNGFCPGL